MSKKCTNCGTELPDDAAFCPKCTQSQIERRPIKPPHLWRKKAAVALTVVVLLAAAALGFYLHNRPKTYEGGASVTYTDSDGTYELLVAFFPSDITAKRTVASKTVSIGAGEESIDTPMLGVFKNGEIATDEFFAKVASCTMTAKPNENGALTLDAPEYSTDFAPAARECTIYYNVNSGTNKLIWTVEMNSGDKIILKQTYEVVPLEHKVYTADDAPLDTVEDIKALLERIDEEVESDTIVDIYLPAVTYQGKLTILSRAVNLYGSTDGDGRTVFVDTLSVQSHNPSNVMLYDIDFVGSGSGTGLEATASVYMERCSFEGWDVGAVALNGGMIGVEDCDFMNNGIGFRYNSTVHSSFNETFSGCEISGNDIGVQFETLIGTISIDFAGSTFSGNRVDIDNPIDYPIKTDGAIFE